MNTTQRQVRRTSVYRVRACVVCVGGGVGGGVRERVHADNKYPLHAWHPINKTVLSETDTVYDLAGKHKQYLLREKLERKQWKKWLRPSK